MAWAVVFVVSTIADFPHPKILSFYTVQVYILYNPCTFFFISSLKHSATCISALLMSFVFGNKAMYSRGEQNSAYF